MWDTKANRFLRSISTRTNCKNFINWQMLKIGKVNGLKSIENKIKNLFPSWIIGQ